MLKSDMTDTIRTDAGAENIPGPAAGPAAEPGSAAASPECSADTYFKDCRDVSPDGYLYEFGFKNIPELRRLISGRPDISMTAEEITAAAVSTFKNKPGSSARHLSDALASDPASDSICAPASGQDPDSGQTSDPSDRKKDNEEGQPVDFIYSM